MDEQYGRMLRYVADEYERGASASYIRYSLQAAGWPPEWIEHGLQATLRGSHESEASEARSARLLDTISDGLKALRFNATSVAITHIAAFFGLLALLVPVGLIGGALSELGVAVACVFWGVVAVLVVAFFLAIGALCVFASTHRQVARAEDVLQAAACRIVHVAIALAAQTIVVLLPFSVTLLVVFGSVLGTRIGRGNLYGELALLIVGPFFMLVAFLVTIALALNYALVPYVALFEPHLRLRELFIRSHNLLKNGGYWFITKGLLLFVLIYLVAHFMLGLNLRSFWPTDNIWLAALLALLLIVANAAITQFYLQRSNKIV